MTFKGTVKIEPEEDLYVATCLGYTVAKGTLKSILIQVEVDLDEFIKLL